VGWLARLLGTRTMNVDVHRKENLNMTVPAARADAVRAAIEQWLAGHGVTAPVTSEDAGEGKVRLRAALGEDEAAKLDFSSEQVQAELQDVLTNALH
jgi:uncharacterized protein YgfB (UPF0149 family)